MQIEIFICYAREDHKYLEELQRHLNLLQRQGHVWIWYDGDISAGKEWEREIEKYLDTAQIVLLLISPDFLASDYCYRKEVVQAMQRYERGEVRVIPVLLRWVHWEDSLFGKLQALPLNGKPVTDIHWYSLDVAFYEVTLGIQKVVKELKSMSDKKVLRQKFLQHKEALAEISRTGFDFCSECGSLEFRDETQIDYAHDEIYYFKCCEECGYSWE